MVTIMPILKSKESEQISTRLSPRELADIERLVAEGFYMNTADFVRQAVREKLASAEIHTVRKVSLAKARREILAYLKRHPVAYPSDIALDLGLDLEITMLAVKELWNERLVEEAKKK